MVGYFWETAKGSQIKCNSAKGTGTVQMHRTRFKTVTHLSTCVSRPSIRLEFRLLTTC